MTPPPPPLWNFSENSSDLVAPSFPEALSQKKERMVKMTKKNMTLNAFSVYQEPSMRANKGL